MNALGQYYGFNDDLENKAKYLKMAAEQPLSKGGEKTFWDYYDTVGESSKYNKKGLYGANNYIITAQHDLGVFYEKREDYEEARKWYKMAEDNGYPNM